MFQRILVPVDGSAYANCALPYAIAIAKHTGGTVHLLSVHSEYEPMLDEVQSVTFEERIHALHAWELRECLEAQARAISVENGIAVTHAVRSGWVARAISRYIREVEIDIVVMSTHGQGGPTRHWLGSVTDQVLHNLKVPALLVRPPAHGAPRPHFKAFERILVALDGSPSAEAGLDLCSALPHSTYAQCTLLHVAVPATLPVTYFPDAARREWDAARFESQEAGRYLSQMTARATGAWPMVYQNVVVATRPAAAILQHANRFQADLIVIGTHGPGRVTRAMLGSVADKIIRGAHVPVFVYPKRALTWEAAIDRAFTSAASEL